MIFVYGNLMHCKTGSCHNSNSEYLSLMQQKYDQMSNMKTSVRPDVITDINDGNIEFSKLFENYMAGNK